LSLSAPRVCCTRFSFSNTSRNPSFRTTVQKHQAGKSNMTSLFPSAPVENSTLLTFVLILICVMLGIIIVFTVVHCAIFCGLTYGKIKKTMKNNDEKEEEHLPYFVLSDYSETSP
ncbi:hypothetical protein PRIPAC_97229, partial [Pristionchus pacificus]